MVFNLNQLKPDAKLFAAFSSEAGSVEYRVRSDHFQFAPPSELFSPMARQGSCGGDAGAARQVSYETTLANPAPTTTDAIQAGHQLPENEQFCCEGFTVVKKLGQGGQGSVWLVLNEAGHKVAVKVCKCTSREQRRQFEIEVQNLKAVTELKLHSNVVRYIDCRAATDMSVLVMEFIEGASLRGHFQSSSGMEWADVQWIMTGILRGLDQLHTLEPPISHRDLKPDHVMLTTAVDGTRQAVLVDFGTSKRADSEQTKTLGEIFVGSPAYFSPEQARGSSLDVRVDVWAAGIVLYELIAGHRPFGRDNADVLRLLEEIKNIDFDEIPELARRLPSATQQISVQKLLRKALAKEREERFADAGAMLAAWESICEQPHVIPELLRVKAKQLTASALADGRELRKPRIFAFFAQERGDTINVWGEAQGLESLMSRFGSFELSMNVQPTFGDFHQALQLSGARNCTVVHMAGHGERRHGFYLVSDRAGLTSHPIDPKVAAGVIGARCCAKGGTIECAVLNACNTEELGLLLREEGVGFVVCWRWKVQDEAAKVFARVFYDQLDILNKTGEKSQEQRYRSAFQSAVVELQVWGSSSHKDEQARARTSCSTEPENLAVFLSQGGTLASLGQLVHGVAKVPASDELAEPLDVAGSAFDLDDSEAARMATNRKGDFEASAFQALGVRLEYPVGIPLKQTIASYRQGRLVASKLGSYGLEGDSRDDPAWAGKKHLRYTRDALKVMFEGTDTPEVELRGYSDLFGAHGPVLQLAKLARKADRSKALLFLNSALQLRESEASGCAAHQAMTRAVRECVQAIQQLDR